MSFDQLLDAVQKLSSEDQEALLRVLTQRRIAERRKVLAHDIEEAENQFKAGQCEAKTPAELMREILS